MSMMDCWTQQSGPLWLEEKSSSTSTVASGITVDVNQGHTHTHTARDANIFNRAFAITHSHGVSLIFPILSLVRREWQSHSLRRLDYSSIKPVIVLDSFYLSPVQYGSLELFGNSVREWKGWTCSKLNIINLMFFISLLCHQHNLNYSVWSFLPLFIYLFCSFPLFSSFSCIFFRRSRSHPRRVFLRIREAALV